VLDVKVLDYPTHAASLPVAVIPNCAATRHVHFHLDGSGPAELTPPNLEDWPQVGWAPDANTRRVNLDTLTRAEVAACVPGERLLLTGKFLTGRDAAHKRICALLDAGEPLPEGLSFKNSRNLFTWVPSILSATKSWGPLVRRPRIGWTRFTETMLAKAGLIAMVGKADRGPEAIEVIKRHKSAYLIAVGGAAYLVSKAIRASRVVAFPELGMEAVYEFDVKTCRLP
jgi:fumarate hydratase class I